MTFSYPNVLIIPETQHFHVKISYLIRQIYTYGGTGRCYIPTLRLFKGSRYYHYFQYIKSVHKTYKPLTVPLSKCIRSHSLSSQLFQLLRQITSTVMKTSSSLFSPLVLPLFVLSSPTPVIVRQDSTTENGFITDPCNALTVTFARGTNEPGNVGDVAGPPFFSALRSDLGTDQVTIQGVDYSADILG